MKYDLKYDFQLHGPDAMIMSIEMRSEPAVVM